VTSSPVTSRIVKGTSTPGSVCKKS
jgi:hypothetical protein